MQVQVLDGSEPVTMKFPDVDPINFTYLSAIHNVTLTIYSDQKVFVLDSEGFHGLSETTPRLIKATLT
jgi:hypothetical protein